MKANTVLFKHYLQLFFPFLIIMLGVGHAISGYNHLIKHAPIFLLGLSYRPTIWTFAATIITTIVAAFIAIRMLLKIRKHQEGNR
ncbi:hypothetical protein [Pedobacter sp. BMA]|uniref:hypothetical protein n=1 Tax=Pedobacter sp. BMA TaxID=1663685 RepID=UPI00064B0DDB|nr:hypothetical protein [Pedobacter sp. BMA]KLT66733.1 hypothetical protein AB669_06110 [Pedobacter sp. BMA]